MSKRSRNGLRWILAIGFAGAFIIGSNELAAHAVGPIVKCVYFSAQNSMAVPAGTFIDCGTPSIPCAGGVIIDPISGGDPFITQGDGLFIPSGVVRVTPRNGEVIYLTAVGTRLFAGPVTVDAFDKNGTLVDKTSSPAGAPSLNLKVVSMAHEIAYLEITGQEVLITQLCFAVSE